MEEQESCPSPALRCLGPNTSMLSASRCCSLLGTVDGALSACVCLGPSNTAWTLPQITENSPLAIKRA